MSDKKTKIPRRLSNQQVIITKFIDPVMFKNKGFWPKEMKIANSLVKKYNLDFLKWVIPPYGKKVPSLCYFVADYGCQYLQEQYFNFNKSKLDLSPKIEKVELSKDKIGEDAVINKPKTLKDFLNLFQTT